MTANVAPWGSVVQVADPAERGVALLPGGERISFALGHGDLLVMGGSCQRTWEHAILKTARPVGLRISVQFRPRGVA